MARDFFRRAASGSTSPSGSTISDIQRALNALGGAVDVDGLFGMQTALALSAFQKSRGLKVTGTVSDIVWSTLMQSAEPPIFQRCLQVTASFEGTGFTLVVGNFDGAGITWGIIGFTLMNGELGAVLKTVSERAPDLIAKAFGDDAAEIMRVCGPSTSKSEKEAWANSVSRGANKYNVADPWKTYFHDLGSFREVQQIQIERAFDKYWKIAARDASDLGMAEELDMLLLYDIAVQNGGMRSKGRLESALTAMTAQKPKSAAAKRRIIAQVVTDTIGKKYQEDVRARKMGIADGAGTIHQGVYSLADWGLADGFVPST